MCWGRANILTSIKTRIGDGVFGHDGVRGGSSKMPSFEACCYGGLLLQRLVVAEARHLSRGHRGEAIIQGTHR